MNDFQIWFFAAIARSSARIVASSTGAGRSSVPLKRMSAGTVSAASSSSVPTPSARNIAVSSASSGPM